MIVVCDTATAFFYFFNDTATTEIFTLSLHDALPISGRPGRAADRREPAGLLVQHRRRDRAPGQPAARRALRGEIGRAHVCTPVTPISRMPASALKKKKHVLLSRHHLGAVMFRPTMLV